MNDRIPDRTSYGISYSLLTLCFLAGGMAGAAAALLLAPQSGKVTREAMGRKVKSAADSARALKDRAIRRGQDIRHEATHRVEGAVAALAGKAEHAQ